MDRVDRLRLLLDGAECAACASTVPPAAIRVLAERDDLVFAELACAACGSVAMTIVTEEGVERDRSGPPVEREDVRDMAAFLETYDGDLRNLVDRPRRRQSR
jgi:hypothetical protein